MPHIRQLKLTLAVLVFVSCTVASARADNFTFSGNFTQDDNVQLFNFTVGGLTTVRLDTTSYAGGANANGTVAPRGGFDPILTLFSSTGVFIAENNDNIFGNSDPVTGQAFDAFIVRALAPGSYTLALTQYDNFRNGTTLGEGFARQGEGNFTIMLFGSGPFVDSNSNQRTSAFTVNFTDVASVSPVDAAPVPEPATVTLLVTGLAGVGAAAVRRRRNNQQ